jgi:hypothetical protein
MFILAAFVSGCETMGNKTGAQMERDRILGLLKKSDADYIICSSANLQTNAYKKFYSEIFIEKEDSPNKFDLLTSKNKLTVNQKEILKEVVVLGGKCRQASLQPLNGLPYQLLKMQLYNSMDEIYLKLLKDEITIGQANEAKVKVLMEAKVSWSKETAELNERLQNSHNQEVNNAQRRAEIFMPYLMQQQLIQQQQQQNFYQQQMQQIINNRPINTRCNTYGNTIDCITR